MEKSPSGATSAALVSTSSPVHQRNNMSTLAIPPPLPLPAFRREPHWDNIRSSAPSLARIDTRNALPSIREVSKAVLEASYHFTNYRQLVPEHLLTSQPQEGNSSGARKTHLTSPAATGPPLQTSPGYTHTSHGEKRRRLSAEDGQEAERARQVPRLYHPSEPSNFPRRESPPAAPRPDGYYSDSQARPVSSGKYPPHGDVTDRPDLRHPRPSLPPSTRPFEQDVHSPYRPSEGPHDGYHGRVPPPPQAHVRTQSTEHPPSYRGDYPYSSYQPPGRFAASAPSSTSAYERTPFTTPPYAMPYQEYGRFGGDMGPGGLVGETKQRKRRGNLPKETTDKLRSWFVAHLQHPYPTEDEKQELMAQTGLQMSEC